MSHFRMWERKLLFSDRIANKLNRDIKCVDGRQREKEQKQNSKIRRRYISLNKPLCHLALQSRPHVMLKDKWIPWNMIAAISDLVCVLTMRTFLTLGSKWTCRNLHGLTGVKAWHHWCQTQFKDKRNLLSKLCDYLFYIALLLNRQMRSTLKTEIFHNPENTNSLFENIYVVIIDKQIRYFWKRCKPVYLQFHVKIFYSAKHFYKCCRNKHYFEFLIFFSFGQTANLSKEELFAICQDAL